VRNPPATLIGACARPWARPGPGLGTWLRPTAQLRPRTRPVAGGRQLLGLCTPVDMPASRRYGPAPMDVSPQQTRRPLRRAFQSAELVLVGNFNPAIIRPSWLARNGLIPDEEADAAEITLLRPEYAGFSIGWATIDVRFDRFAVASTDESQWVTLRDLLVGVFALLDQTPVSAMGFNLSAHCQFAEEEALDPLLSKLSALPAVWKSWIDRPILRQQKVKGARPKGGGTEYTIEVQPSVVVERALFFKAHEHYANESEDVGVVLDILQSEWDGFFEHSIGTFEAVAYDWISEAE